MNPIHRKLRLRKSTLRNLGPDQASNVAGGTIVTIAGSCFLCPPDSEDIAKCEIVPSGEDSCQVGCSEECPTEAYSCPGDFACQPLYCPDSWMPC